MNNAEKLASFIVETQAIIRHIGETFNDPDDDWMSTAVLQGKEGINIIAMDGTMFENEGVKDMLALWLKSAMLNLEADRYAVLFNVHGIENPSEEDWEAHRNGKRLSEFPNAYELLMLIAGDAEQELCYEARINRDGIAPPTFAEWRLVPHFEGRFARLNERMASVS